MVKLEKCPEGVSIEEFNRYNNYVESANKLMKKISSEKVMGEMFKLINDTFSTFIRFSYDVKNDGRNDYITIESENFAPQHPILYNAWEKFTISSFGCGEVNNSVSFKNIPKEPEFWMILAYSYVHHGGGCNSATIGYVRYTESEGWKIIHKKK
jgi:hypothetical protein